MTTEVKRDAGVVVTMETRSNEAPKGDKMTSEELAKEYGKNRYSRVMADFHLSLRALYGLSDAQAMRAAKTLGADLGRGQIKDIKIGNATKKDNIITVKDVGGYKGPTTYAIALAKSCALLKEAYKYGITVSAEKGVEIQPVYEAWLNEKSTTEVLGAE